MKDTFMGKSVSFIKKDGVLLLRYRPELGDPKWVCNKINSDCVVCIRKTFNFEKRDLINHNEEDADYSEYVFKLGIAEEGYFRIDKRILDLHHDLLLYKKMKFDLGKFTSVRDISIFSRIDRLIDEPIIIGGNSQRAIPLDSFEELLRNFPTTTEINRYSDTRVFGVLRDYFSTMSDAQYAFEAFLNKKKTIKCRSKTEFFKDYEAKKFKYNHDEIEEMLRNTELFSEVQWQKKIIEFLLLIFPKYISALEYVHVKDYYSSPNKTTSRQMDILLVDADGNVDGIEIKRPRQNQLLSKKTSSRGNYIPNRELSEAIMQIEKYLFHLNKWGVHGERGIQEKQKNKLPENIKIKIANPKAMLIIGRDSDFDDRKKLDFEIIRRQYASIVDILTYDDILRRLKRIINMIQRREHGIP